MTCPVDGCGRVPSTTRYGVRLLMCGRHWHRVPLPVRTRLWRAYGAMMREATQEAVYEYSSVRREAIWHASRTSGHQDLPLSPGLPHGVDNADVQRPSSGSTIRRSGDLPTES